MTKFKATDKAPDIEKLFTSLIEGARCVICQSPDLNFRDPLSQEEYAISGMCQRCQDETFGV